MRRNRLFLAFAATLVVAVLLRLFVIDVISVSNDLLQPQFYPGDFLLVSKVSAAEEGQWVLLKDYPKKSIYAIRRLIKRAGDQGWEALEPATEATKEENNFIGHNQIVGKAVMILWSLPCKPAIVAAGQCPEKRSRYFKSIQ